MRRRDPRALVSTLRHASRRAVRASVLQGLRSTAGELAAGDGPDVVLPRIAARLTAAYPGSSCLVLVTPAPGSPTIAAAAGPAQDAVHRAAEHAQAGRPPASGALVSEVRVGQRSFGHIVVVGAPASDDLRDLMAAYAGHAAAVASRYEALEQAGWARGRAASLASLSHDLVGTTDPREVAELVAAALPQTLGCDSAGFWLWHPERGELCPAATAGLAAEQIQAMRQHPIRPSQTPELSTLLAQREPAVLQVDEVTPAVAEVMRMLGLRTSVAVPLMGGTRLLGAVITSWVAEQLPGPGLDEALARLQGVADRASTALQNAHLVETVRHQALHDPLTRLPNRVLFHDRLDTALLAAGRSGGVSVLFCDLDRFKQINDVMGHAAGDEVLRQVASRLSEAVRPGDTVGRLSGDEFAAVLPGVSEVAAAEEVAQRLLGCLDQPLRIDGQQLLVTASIGVAVHLGPGGTSELLLHSADAAMYTAKRQGRGRIVTADNVVPVVSGGSASLSAQLRAGIAAGDLRLLFQPVLHAALPSGSGEVDCPQGRLVGAEALVRWEHPRLGLLPPAAFVPHAEQDGSILELDRWVLREACREAATWARLPGAVQQRVAVNLSVRSLSDPGLEEAVRRALVDSGLPPHLLHLEVLESRALLDLPSVVERLTALRHLGVRVVLDDFGTGYSTLSWLLDLPVDQIKIDRIFVVACAQTADRRQQVTARALLRGFVAVGAELDVEVLAEGVETAEQFDAVRQLGCTLVQGFLIGRPAPADEHRRRIEAEEDRMPVGPSRRAAPS